MQRRSYSNAENYNPKLGGNYGKGTFVVDARCTNSCHYFACLIFPSLNFTLCRWGMHQIMQRSSLVNFVQVIVVEHSAVSWQSSGVSFARTINTKLENTNMNGIIYLVGLVVVVLFILSFFGLH